MSRITIFAIERNRPVAARVVPASWPASLLVPTTRPFLRPAAGSAASPTTSAFSARQTRPRSAILSDPAIPKKGKSFSHMGQGGPIRQHREPVRREGAVRELVPGGSHRGAQGPRIGFRARGGREDRCEMEAAGGVRGYGRVRDADQGQCTMAGCPVARRLSMAQLLGVLFDGELRSWDGPAGRPPRYADGA